jgi:IS5 family transposase
MKRRAAVEPIIGHLKSDYRLNRNHLKGKAGDQANVVLAAAAYNIAKLLAWFYWPRYFKAIFYDLMQINCMNQKIMVT